MFRNKTMDNGLNEKIERWKLLAVDYKDENKKLCIKDFDGNLYFCKIINFPNEKKVKIKCSGPPQRAGTEPELRWLELTKFEEFVGR